MAGSVVLGITLALPAPLTGDELLQSLTNVSTSNATNSSWVTQYAQVDKSAAPSNLVGAAAPELSVTRIELLDSTDFFRALELSKDGSTLFYVRRQEGLGRPRLTELVVRNLRSGAISKTVPLPDFPSALGLDHTGKRLLTLDDGNRTMAVVDLDSGQRQELPINGLPLCGFCAIEWNAPTSAVVLNKRYPEQSARVDLDNLLIKKLDTSGKGSSVLANTLLEKRLSPLAEGQLFRLERINDGLFAVGAVGEGTYYRLLVPAFDEGFLPSADSTTVYLIDWNAAASPSSKLVRIVIGRRPAPRLTFKVDFDPSVLGRSLKSFQQLLSMGKPIYGTVGAARLNPLNGKIVGSDGSERGGVRLSQEADGTWKAIVFRELAPIVPGNVVWRLWSDGYSVNGPNLDFRQEGFFLTLE